MLLVCVDVYVSLCRSTGDKVAQCIELQQSREYNYFMSIHLSGADRVEQ